MEKDEWVINMLEFRPYFYVDEMKTRYRLDGSIGLFLFICGIILFLADYLFDLNLIGAVSALICSGILLVLFDSLLKIKNHEQTFK